MPVGDRPRMVTLEGLFDARFGITTSTTTSFETCRAPSLAEAISGMNRADTAYKAALGAVSSATRVSLLDYLG